MIKKISNKKEKQIKNNKKILKKEKKINKNNNSKTDIDRLLNISIEKNDHY